VPLTTLACGTSGDRTPNVEFFLDLFNGLLLCHRLDGFVVVLRTEVFAPLHFAAKYPLPNKNIPIFLPKLGFRIFFTANRAAQASGSAKPPFSERGYAPGGSPLKKASPNTTADGACTLQ
jgi:hypothetical protein